MSISDKLITIAENQEKVYKAGQSSMVDESKIIEKTVSGEYISVDDVSEIPHEVKAQLTSGGGKNLWKRGDQTFTRASYTNPIELSAGKTYTFSALVTSSDTDNDECLIYDATNAILLGYIKRDVRSSITFTLDKDITILSLYAGHNNALSAGDTATFKDIMIEEGNTATKYEPYKETLTDYSGVSLTRCGNSIIPYPYHYADNRTENGITWTVNEDKTITANGTATAQSTFYLHAKWADTFMLHSGTYYFKCSPVGANSTTYYSSLEYIDQSGVTKYINDLQENGLTFTTDVSSFCTIVLIVKAGVTVNNLVFKPMLNFGSTALPYEPYNGQTITANSDGTVEGITSQAPYMYMTTDNFNVTVNATYHKSYGMQTEYDRFWDTFQSNGNRTDYSSAFKGDCWTDSIFKPKYKLQPTNANSMFIRTKITDIRMVDLTKVTDVGSLCNSSTQGIRYAGQVGNSSITTFGSAFGWCHKLISVEKMIVGANAQFGNTFTGCYDLESITFEGTIGYSISLGDSTKLNKTSMLSIFNALSSSKTGLTLTLSTTAVTNAFGSTTSTEWTNLVASKSNWTISLV